MHIYIYNVRIQFIHCTWVCTHTHCTWVCTRVHVMVLPCCRCFSTGVLDHRARNAIDILEHAGHCVLNWMVMVLCVNSVCEHRCSVVTVHMYSTHVYMCTVHVYMCTCIYWSFLHLLFMAMCIGYTGKVPARCNLFCKLFKNNFFTRNIHVHVQCRLRMYM